MCERWVGDWTNCNILTPSSFVFSSTSFSLCWVLVISTASYLQLTQLVCGTGLYNCLTSTRFLCTSHLHPIQPVHSQGYTLIYSTGCTCSLIYGWVEGQYVTAILRSLLDKYFYPPMYEFNNTTTFQPEGYQPKKVDMPLNKPFCFSLLIDILSFIKSSRRYLFRIMTWSVGWLWDINLYSLFNAESILMPIINFILDNSV